MTSFPFEATLQFLAYLMPSVLAKSIDALASHSAAERAAGAAELYRAGRVAAESAISRWWNDAELAKLLCAPNPQITVGIALEPETFAHIRKANHLPRLAAVPPDQDAEEFELHFEDGVSLDILTTKQPGGPGAIARYLTKLGEGVQQVEFRCGDVDRATLILKEKFGVVAVYPETRNGADGTRINFFLVARQDDTKVLVELYEIKEDHA